MQWPLTSQLHGSVSQREQLSFRYGSNSTPAKLDTIIEILELESRLAQVLQIFFLGKEHLVKHRLISTLDKVIYFTGTIFRLSTKPLFTSQNRVELS
jgi:hypothetical protein